MHYHQLPLKPITLPLPPRTTTSTRLPTHVSPHLRPSYKRTPFGTPKLFKLPSLKKLTHLSNTPFSQHTSSQTFNTLPPKTSPPELNVSSVTPIKFLPDSPPKTLASIPLSRHQKLQLQCLLIFSNFLLSTYFTNFTFASSLCTSSTLILQLNTFVMSANCVVS